MRTQREITDRIQSLCGHDLLGAQTDELLKFLPPVSKSQDREVIQDEIFFAVERSLLDPHAVTLIRLAHRVTSLAWILRDDIGDLIDIDYSDAVEKICKFYEWVD